ncbi:hypothetical protein BGZ65_009535, partial [Modicella reniformis]
MLGDIDESTIPFGYSEVHLGGAEITESHQILTQELNDRLRVQAKQMGVSLASLCHVAWALVLARASGQERVVFGTVLFGGMQDDQEVDHAMGLSINTLPFRCDISSQSIQECVCQTHTRLAALLEHEHASLSMAQRCSGVIPGTPLFTTLLNYLHTSLVSSKSPEASGMEFISQEEQVHYPGIEFLEGRERTNYPFTMNVLDSGADLGLTVQAIRAVDPVRVRDYMLQALDSLVVALASNPNIAGQELEVMPSEEQKVLTEGWNALMTFYPQNQTIHGLFEEQVKHTPQATALVFMDQSMTYTELNIRSNRLAHHLIELGVQPDMRVAICVERSFAMIIGVLAILKAGGAYVPLDPSYPKERLIDILEDAAPVILLVDNGGRAILTDAGLMRLMDNDTSPIIADVNDQVLCPCKNPEVTSLTSRHLAYVMYTSGSTGRPKGVMVEHKGVVNHVTCRLEDHGLDESSRVLQSTSLSFDVSVLEIFTALCSGGSLHLLQDDIRRDLPQLWSFVQQHFITHASLTPAILQSCKDLPRLTTPLQLTLAGEALSPSLLRALQPLLPKDSLIINEYGPTETTIIATKWKSPEVFDDHIVPIGRPTANKKIYILDIYGQSVPLGAEGELYIGGVGVARGYFNRPELTAK